MYQGPLPGPGGGPKSGFGGGVHPPYAWLPPVARAQHWSPSASESLARTCLHGKGSSSAKMRDRSADFRMGPALPQLSGASLFPFGGGGSLGGCPGSSEGSRAIGHA